MNEDHVIAPAIPVLNEEGIHRLRRIETLLHVLCQHIGFDPKKKQRIQVVSTSPAFVELGGFDVSIGDILTGVKEAGIVEGIVTMLHKGTLVGTIAVKRIQLQGVDSNDSTKESEVRT